MSIEFNQPINYVTNYNLSNVTTAWQYLTDTTTIKGKTVITDLVVSLYSPSPFYYSINVQNEKLYLNNIPSTTTNPWTDYTSSNLAAGIFGITPIVVKIPGPITLNSGDVIMIRVRCLDSYAKCWILSSHHVSFH